MNFLNSYPTKRPDFDTITCTPLPFFLLHTHLPTHKTAVLLIFAFKTLITLISKAVACPVRGGLLPAVRFNSILCSPICLPELGFFTPVCKIHPCHFPLLYSISPCECIIM